MKPESRAAIAAARTGKKWSRTVRAAIGKGVRHGAENKVPFNTRISPEADATIRAKAKARGVPLSRAAEQAFESW